MANIKSQIKRNKQNEKRRLRNRNFRGAARTAVKNTEKALATGEEAQASLQNAISALDKAAEKGVIHRKNAARRKSRLMKAANKAAGVSKSTDTEKVKAEPKKKATPKKKVTAKKKTAAKE